MNDVVASFVLSAAATALFLALLQGCIADIKTQEPIGVVEETSVEVEKGKTLQLIRTKNKSIRAGGPLKIARGDTVWIAGDGYDWVCVKDGSFKHPRTDELCAIIYEMKRVQSKMSVDK